jgi:hypothetical protein
MFRTYGTLIIIALFFAVPMGQRYNMGRASGTMKYIHSLMSEADKRALGSVHIVATGFNPLYSNGE